MIVFAKFSRTRMPQYQLSTLIEDSAGVRTVIKRALHPLASAHVQRLVEVHRSLAEKFQGTALEVPRIVGSDPTEVRLTFLEGTSFDAKLVECFRRRDRSGFLSLLGSFSNALSCLAPHSDAATLRPETVLGVETRGWAPTEPWIAPGLLDANFDNVLTLNGGKIGIIDNEWMADTALPLSLVVHRALQVFYRYKYSDLAWDSFVSLNEAEEFCGISKGLQTDYLAVEEAFQKMVYGDRQATLNQYRRPVLRLTGVHGVHTDDPSLQDLIQTKDYERQQSLELLREESSRERERLLRIKDQERERLLELVRAEAEGERGRILAIKDRERAQDLDLVREEAAQERLRILQIKDGERELGLQLVREEAARERDRIIQVKDQQMEELRRELRFGELGRRLARFADRVRQYFGKRLRRLPWFPDAKLVFQLDPPERLYFWGSEISLRGVCHHKRWKVMAVSLTSFATPIRLQATDGRFEGRFQAPEPGVFSLRFEIALSNGGLRRRWTSHRVWVKMKEVLAREVTLPPTRELVLPCGPLGGPLVRVEVALGSGSPRSGHLRVDRGDSLTSTTWIRASRSVVRGEPGRVVYRFPEPEGGLHSRQLLRFSGELEGKIARIFVGRSEEPITLEQNRPLLPWIMGEEAPSGGVFPRQESVTIIVCVHNAPEDVRRCLDSLVRSTEFPYTVILVDDGSQTETQELLREFADSQGWTLIRNDAARGYTFAANQGLAASTDPYVVLLNSDTIVSWGWLERLVRCASSDPQIGLVGPLSNTASWQSVPRIFGLDGDWSDNPLDADETPDSMAALVSAESGKRYPRVGFLNGFCLMIKRGVLDQVGCFDEVNFGAGYGEENDYCIRAQAAGWQLAVAEDAYVFHAQSKSYSTERRLQLAERAGQQLRLLHGQPEIDRLLFLTKDNLVLTDMRHRLLGARARQNLRAEIRRKWEGKKVLFLLPSGGLGGGTNVVVHEAELMVELGVDARIFNLTEFKASFIADYPDAKVPLVFGVPSDVLRLAENYDALIATANTSVAWMAEVENTAVSLGYYVQDYEPDFYAPGSPDQMRAIESYTATTRLRLFCKTEWNRAILQERLWVEATAVGISFQSPIFRPNNSFFAKATRPQVFVCAMIRPFTPRRNPALTLEVLRQVSERCQGSVRIFLFGCRSDDGEFLALRRDFPYEHLGILNNQQMAKALSEMDVFADLSVFQAMGLTALEAMASGVAVVVPQRGGAPEFVHDGVNGLVVDTDSVDQCVAAVLRLVQDAELRRRIQVQAMAVSDQWAERSVHGILSLLLRPNTEAL